MLLFATLLIVILFHIRLWHQQKGIRPSGESPVYGGMAGVLRAMLLLVIMLLGFDFLLPDFLSRVLVEASVASQVLELLRDLRLTI